MLCVNSNQIQENSKLCVINKKNYYVHKKHDKMKFFMMQFVLLTIK